MGTTYGLYLHSHWQGSGSDRLVAVGSRAVVEHAAAQLEPPGAAPPETEST